MDSTCLASLCTCRGQLVEGEWTEGQIGMELMHGTVVNGRWKYDNSDTSTL